MKSPICCPSIRIPRLDLGTWFIENGRAARTVRNAVDIGCRHFGTAPARFARQSAAAACAISGKKQGGLNMDEFKDIFPRGGENTAFAQYFVGQSYLNMLSLEQVAIGNVTFEPGCRNNWHIHHARSGGGQILLVTSGRGYYQEWGKPARELRPGDVVNIPAGVKHWHGAAPDSWFAHLTVEVPGEETRNEWCEPVSDADYGRLK